MWVSALLNQFSQKLPKIVYGEDSEVPSGFTQTPSFTIGGIIESVPDVVGILNNTLKFFYVDTSIIITTMEN